MQVDANSSDSFCYASSEPKFERREVYQVFVAPSKFMNMFVSLVAESTTFRSIAAVFSKVFMCESMPSSVPLSSLRRLHSTAQFDEQRVLAATDTHIRTERCVGLRGQNERENAQKTRGPLLLNLKGAAFWPQYRHVDVV
jgi:hypothetical protein